MSILGRAITVVQSNKHPKMAANSSINGHNSCKLNLKTWSLERGSNMEKIVIDFDMM